ncbi:MAG TPA: hypothetical protein VHD39_00735 [Acidimicrobiales bacterium]|nr:hypothetical protein [Acidimicrobiales bacterium]
MRDTGLRGFWSGYFAARAAPLGHVGAGPVTAAFFNFAPAMVARAVPGCWDVVAPATLCRVRAIAAAEALNEVCATGTRSALIAALPLLRRAVDGADAAGRTLAGANRTLWPQIAPALGTGGLGEAWQATTTLREHRGDGHVATLVAKGLRGIDAHLLAAGTKGIPTELLRENRGWSEEAWADAAAALVRRGLLHGDGRATDAGRTLHAEVEATTDRLAAPAYAGLSDAALEDLLGALAGCAAEVAAAGVLPFPNPMGLPDVRVQARPHSG